MAKEAPFRHKDGSNCWHEDCKTDERKALAEARKAQEEADRQARALEKARERTEKAAQREKDKAERDAERARVKARRDGLRNLIKVEKEGVKLLQAIKKEQDDAEKARNKALEASRIAAEKLNNPTEEGARQKHGFKNEVRIKEKYGLQKYTDVKSNDYTSTYDAVAPNGKPVSIKTEGLGSNIELGDYFRNANANEDFYMVVSFWQGEKDNIVEEYKLLVPAEEWTKNFDRSFDNKIRTLISEASNDESYDEEWKRRRLALNEEYGADQFIRLRPKRDHKKQKRMQAAISYQDFVKFAEKHETKDFEKWDKNEPVL